MAPLAYCHHVGKQFLQESLDTQSYVSEVLIIGATGEVSRLVVRWLLLERPFHVLAACTQLAFPDTESAGGWSKLLPR
jgi:hypothetical protein